MAAASSTATSRRPNELHKQKFQELHEELVRCVNPSSVIDYLFARNVLSAEDLRDLEEIGDRVKRCRRLATLLHTTSHPQAFIHLRLAIMNEPAYSWLENKMRGLALAGAAEVVQTFAEGNPVCGVTLLDSELYVLRSQKGEDAVEVYDTNNYSLKRCMSVPGLRGLADMTSCRHNRCLYISDRLVKCVHKLQLDGNVKQWPVGDTPNGLSVTVNRNLLVTCPEARKLKLLNSSSGDIVSEIVLRPAVANPLHAVHLTSGQFVVCHGTDAVNRVCLVAADGKTVSSYGGQRGSAAGQLNGPVRLAVDVDGFIFVVDVNNKRVLQLSQSLQFMCDVVSRGQGFKWWPFRLCIRVNKRCLYVADCDTDGNKLTAGRLVVFRL